ncbi:amino acid adenylation domain-containing protein [Vogesella oryzae]|uniref:amino acid adenylation domain-containing protein n=1 Tax=Vogesella oryzae TaxID=1735285 RepID=UPI0015826E5C|nr:amino acid adenylation domain-containing protein [Vogesella oryzae]
MSTQMHTLQAFLQQHIQSSYIQPGPYLHTLPAMLLAQVHRCKSDIAIADQEKEYSYETTLLHAIGIAAALRKKGVSYNDCLGLFIDASADLPLATWGILFAGAAYLPLATDYPQDRLSYMVSDAKVKLVLTNNRSHERLASILLPGVSLFNIDDVTPASIAEVDQVLTDLLEQDGEDLAYVIYTSGTTGKPKGVAISQQAIANQLAWLTHEGYLLPGHRILQKTPVSFDAAQWELLGMCCGARVVMGLPGVYRDPEMLVSQIRQHGVTTLQGVPTLLQALSELPAFANCDTLHSLFSGGEGLSRKLARNLLQILPDCRLINLYGPTECTINATHYRIDQRSLEQEWEIAPIGLPVTGLYCQVLDEQLVPVPPGQTGELFIGGAQLANGYLFRPEQTEEKFPLLQPDADTPPKRMYRTGDLVRTGQDGILHFVGRTDNQVKFRGYRIELDEIRLAIENHDWVKSAAVFIKDSPRNGHTQLIGAVELNPNEAKLMDQGNAEMHHQTKASRHQIKAQLSGGGFRSDTDLAGKQQIALPGQQETTAQRERVFARKTYRFFHGGPVTATDILQLLAAQPEAVTSAGLADLTPTILGEILRYLGQFGSEERLLPKFGYASPGALYATQVYIELNRIAGLPDGYYYYHPLQHRLYKQADSNAHEPRLRLHFAGKIPAVREVYKNNILEVLEMESGHILGMLDHILPDYGYAIGQGLHTPDVIPRLDCPEEHEYLGSYDIVPLANRIDDLDIDIYVQAQQGRIRDLTDGNYLYRQGKLDKVSNHLIEQRHVIAINQQVYQRASGGLSFVNRHQASWRYYIDLGRSLQRIQMNRLGLGTMSSGYSSKSGNNLATALRLNDIVSDAGRSAGPSYFCLLGKVSAAQIRHQGMDEDAVHMKGPAELIRADLLNSLPDYMVPGRIAIINKMPHTTSGKVDVQALKQHDDFQLADQEQPHVAARNTTEQAISQIWCQILQLEEVSVITDFFALGGNSIQAVAIARAINRQFAVKVPIQVLFSAPTIEKLARVINTGDGQTASRAIALAGQDSPFATFCWPGLGGYPMNLRLLGEAMAGKRRFYGIQSRGINAGETAFNSIEAMAREDMRLIRSLQPKGPYNLWGYSFGARVAYEVAHQLEQQGETVSQLVLLAPGSPQLPYAEPVSRDESVLFANPAFLSILLSVFAHDINPALNADCLQRVDNRTAFIRFVEEKFPTIDRTLIDAIVNVVTVTYSPDYQIDLASKPLRCPISVWRASGDGPSFIAGGEQVGLNIQWHDLAVGHYAVLKAEGIAAMQAAVLD